ncbi:MAG: thiamine-phosphate kinase [Candidatus Hodarchaeales archaeon]
MKHKDFNEKEIIDLVQKYIDKSPMIGKNEDAYLISSGLPHQLINIDTMCRNSDFLPDQSYNQIAAKLVTMTFSDLAAKGSLPLYFLSSLIIDNQFNSDDIISLVRGLKTTTNHFNAKYLGGDLGSATEAVLTGIGIGFIDNGKLLPRNGAKVGDLVYVTGHFGLTSLAFDYLLRDNSVKEKQDIPKDLLELSLKYVYEPKPKIKQGRLLSQHNLASSCIDSSDGLSLSLYWISHESNLGIVVDSLPIHPKLKPFLRTEKEQFDKVMYGGEEYELVFTIPKNKKELFESVFDNNGLTYTKIGKCIPEKGVFSSISGKVEAMEIKGWDAFNKQAKILTINIDDNKRDAPTGI